MAINDRPIRQKPIPRTQRTKYDGTPRFNQIPNKDDRSQQIRRGDDTFKNISIGLQDIDESIMYFFKQVIKPRVIENGVLIDVPIMYGDPEFWAQIQTQGYAQDKKGKIIAPVIMFRRTGITRDATGIYVDKADRNIVHVFPKKWSNEQNKYDRFSLVNNIKPTFELYNIVVPDYVMLTYECSIWLSFIPQMNKIVETIQYWEGQYWGDPAKFKFKSKIETFDQNVEISTTKGRIVRSKFHLNISGFLIPEVANDQITTQKTYTKQQIIMDTETEVDVLALTATDPLAQRIIVTTSTQPAVQGNQTVTDMINAAIANVQLEVNYLRKLKVYSTMTTAGASIQPGSIAIVTYPSVYTASAPSYGSLTATNEDDFLVFVNGQYMEHQTFTIQQSGSSFVINADTGSLGYELTGSDEIIIWGKFK